MNKKLLPKSLDSPPPLPSQWDDWADLIKISGELNYQASCYALEDDDGCYQEGLYSWKNSREEQQQQQKENVQMEGVKHDNKKPDYSLIPPNALESIAKVMTHGAQKYDRHNWKKLDNPVNRYFSAAQRHLWAVKKGEDLDPESGEHHYAHALCCIMFLLEFYSLQNDKNSI
jgi:hypothetical protein